MKPSFLPNLIINRFSYHWSTLLPRKENPAISLRKSIKFKIQLNGFLIREIHVESIDGLRASDYTRQNPNEDNTQAGEVLPNRDVFPSKEFIMEDDWEDKNEHGVGGGSNQGHKVGEVGDGYGYEGDNDHC